MTSVGYKGFPNSVVGFYPAEIPIIQALSSQFPISSTEGRIWTFLFSLSLSMDRIVSRLFLPTWIPFFCQVDFIS